MHVGTLCAVWSWFKGLRSEIPDVDFAVVDFIRIVPFQLEEESNDESLGTRPNMFFEKYVLTLYFLQKSSSKPKFSFASS